MCIRDRNWGAFLFPVIWGLANHVYQALWCFIPVIGFFYAFHLGSHGNEFAWKHRYWESIAHFKRVQRRFAAWSIGITVAAIALYIGAAIASNRAAERAERIYETRLAALDESIKGTPEWQSLAGSRTLWTDALAKEKFDAYPTEPVSYTHLDVYKRQQRLCGPQARGGRNAFLPERKSIPP